MTASHPLIRAFAGITFAGPSASKRFARDMLASAPNTELTARQEAFAWRIAYHYRRQLPRALAEEAVRLKMDHRAKPEGRFTWRCSVCGRLLGKRDLNAPCPGTAEGVARAKPAEAARVAEAVTLPLFDG